MASTSNRRTNADTFALGLWAGRAITELDDMIEGAPQAAAPLTAIKLVIQLAQDNGDLDTLGKLREHWTNAEAGVTVA